MWIATLLGPQIGASLEAASDGGRNSMQFNINGRAHDLEVDPRTSLLDLLREHLRLTGTKKGCDQGACGACTVLADGVRINSCLALAVQYEGRKITTVEGLSAEPELHPLQRTFIEHDGFQCGYCTSGQMCSAIAMVDEAERGVPSALTENLCSQAIELTHNELRERMSGNLCRCGAYNGIIDAIDGTLVKRHAVVGSTEPSGSLAQEGAR
jgi:xanthine dehydrogenase YagT iron-sulfur-binding subunit